MCNLSAYDHRNRRLLLKRQLGLERGKVRDRNGVGVESWLERLVRRGRRLGTSRPDVLSVVGGNCGGGR